MPEQFDAAWEYWTGDPEVEEFLAEQANPRALLALYRMPGAFDDIRGFGFVRAIRNGYVTCKPRQKRPEQHREPKDKHARYRKRLQSEGKCPRCGTPCAPYFECQDHRESRKARKKAYYRLKNELPDEFGNLPRGKYSVAPPVVKAVRELVKMVKANENPGDVARRLIPELEKIMKQKQVGSVTEQTAVEAAS